ncbi:pilus assembly protein TadG-related protein [Nocardioides sp. SYSU DS0651]|uniref:pilus assembly protein TadG-related protein n=1 Tax=Nocardioides sp. SYSU DS0651 TaxID=3415955 RepID=UPI003F4C6E2D
MSARPGVATSERGQATPLIVGFAAVLLLLVAVVVDASVAYLERQRLDALADGAALHGADLGAQGEQAYTGGLAAGDLPISPREAERAVRGYLRMVGAHADHPGLRAVVRVRGDRVVVELSAPVDLPLTVPGAPARPRVRSVGSAVVDPQE